MSESPLDIFDLLLSPLYILLVFLLAGAHKSANIKQPGKQHYRYFLPALACKIIGGISVCLIYTYYYKTGGDVTNYYYTARTFSNVLLHGDFEKFFNLFSLSSGGILDVAYGDYGMVCFNVNDTYALFTVWLTIPFCLLGMQCFMPTTILVASVSFIGLWKLYEVFVAHFPEVYKACAVAIFFAPSVFFWGSGILKDTYALSSIGFYTYAVYRFIINKDRQVKYAVLLVVSVTVIIFIKPYIFFALLPGTIIWNYFYRIQMIKNAVIRVLALPAILVLVGTLALFGLKFFGQYLGEYSLDNILQKAVKTQQDLIRNQYGSNSYNIGSFEPTVAGISSKIPAAINMALFRPYIWDARNPVMLISGLENLFMLGLSLYILLRVNFAVLVKTLFGHPFLIFSFLFALFFAFSVGLTTANYGALVRLKIPCIPFYLCSLFILFQLNMETLRLRRRWSGR
jgi:hypothetical protein